VRLFVWVYVIFVMMVVVLFR